MKRFWPLLLLAACTEVSLQVFTSLPPLESPLPTVKHSPTSRQRSPALDVTDAGLVLAWCDDDTNPPNLLVGGLIDGGLELVGTVLNDIHHGQCGNPHLSARPDGWLLSTQLGVGSVGFWHVSPEAVPTHGRLLGGPCASGDFSATWSEGGLLGVWTCELGPEYDIWAGVVGADNSFPQDAGTITPGRRYDYRPLIARVGSEVVVAWSRFSDVLNFDDDLVGRWLSRDAGFAVPQMANQIPAAATGGKSVALISWFDTATNSLFIVRAKPDGTFVEGDPRSLGPCSSELVAVTTTDQGFLVAYEAPSDAGVALRLVALPESGDPSEGVWLADGWTGGGPSRPGLTPHWLAFARFELDGGSQVQLRRLGPGLPGTACRLHGDCLTGRCDGVCVEN